MTCILRRTRSLLAFSVLLSSLALGQGKPITSDDLVRMKKAGFSDETMIKAIETNGTAVDTSVDGLMLLKGGGLSDAVIAVALSGKSSQAPGSAAKPYMGQIPAEVGVHLVYGGNLKPLPVELVSMKAAGMWKTMAFMKASLLGSITGSRSSTQFSGPVQVVIRCPDGTVPSEYQLVLLEQKKSSREFLAGKGGATGVSMGVEEKSKVTLQFERIGPNVHRASIESLAPGEYGFLAPGSLSSATIASTSKMYTFGVH